MKRKKVPKGRKIAAKRLRGGSKKTASAEVRGTGLTGWKLFVKTQGMQRRGSGVKLPKGVTALAAAKKVWNVMTAEEKQPYRDLAKALNVRLPLFAGFYVAAVSHRWFVLCLVPIRMELLYLAPAIRMELWFRPFQLAYVAYVRAVLLHPALLQCQSNPF